MSKKSFPSPLPIKLQIFPEHALVSNLTIKLAGILRAICAVFNEQLEKQGIVLSKSVIFLSDDVRSGLHSHVCIENT